MYNNYQIKTEAPEGVEFNEFAKYILAELEHEGSCVFDIDDSVEDHDTYCQLHRAAYNAGYELLACDDGDGMAGQYVILDKVPVSNERVK